MAEITPRFAFPITFLSHAWPRSLFLDAAHEAELMLAPDHEEPRRDHHRGPGEDDLQGPLAEQQIAECERPDHRGVIEGRERRNAGMAIACGQKDLSHPAENAGCDEDHSIPEAWHPATPEKREERQRR